MAVLEPKDTVKIGPEFYVSVSTAGKVTIDPDTEVAVEGTSADAPAWTLIAFSRLPLSFSEPQVVTDVFDHFGISHTKRGRQQRKTLSIRKAFTNMGQSFRKYAKAEMLVKVEVRPDDAATPTETWYFTSVRVLTPSVEIGDEEGTESIECIYAQFGFKDNTAGA
jgi:hypothetical protein